MPAIDIRKIKALIELVEKSGVSEIEIKQEGGDSIRISKGNIPILPTSHHLIHQTPLATPQAHAPALEKAHKPIESPASSQTDPNHEIKSPMVGTAYLASKPGEKPFFEIGQRVAVGDVICLIEAMKMFNQIESDKNGILRARLVENGQPVEYGQPLFVVEPE